MKFDPQTEFEKSYWLALGGIVLSMGHVEQELELLLQDILRNKRLTSNLITGFQSEKAVEIIKATFYAKDRNEDATITFEYLMQKLSKLLADRNKNFHCQWFFDEKLQTATRQKLGKHKRGIIQTIDWVKHVPLDELENLRQDLWTFKGDLHTFGLAYFLPSAVKFSLDTKQGVEYRRMLLLLDAMRAISKEAKKKLKQKRPLQTK